MLPGSALQFFALFSFCTLYSFFTPKLIIMKNVLILICLSLFSITFINAQSSEKKNALEWQYWSRAGLYGFDSHQLGLALSRHLNGRFSVEVSAGLRMKLENSTCTDYFKSGYFSLLGKVHFLKNRRLNVHLGPILETKRQYELDQNLKYKLGLGYQQNIKGPLYIQLNGGLIGDRNQGAFYGGIGLGYSF